MAPEVVDDGAAPAVVPHPDGDEVPEEPTWAGSADEPLPAAAASTPQWDAVVLWLDAPARPVETVAFESDCEGLPADTVVGWTEIAPGGGLG